MSRGEAGSEEKSRFLLKRCDICLTEDCKKQGKSPRSCNCRECPSIEDCPRILHATIRITNKCTQECRHCCFSSSPKSEIMMSLEMAKNIRKFINANGVLGLNIMGGEFFCNPKWYEILREFLESDAVSVRIVSNGDWHGSKTIKEKMSSLIDVYRKKITLDISEDIFHTNSWKNTSLPGFIKLSGVGTTKNPFQTTERSIVPIGRSWLVPSFYSISTYCGNPFNSYSFLIDEEGNIYKCSFGVCGYTNIMNHLDGSFRKKFKDFGIRFYSAGIMNCSSCIRAFEEGRPIEHFKRLKRE